LKRLRTCRKTDYVANEKSLEQGIIRLNTGRILALCPCSHLDQKRVEVLLPYEELLNLYLCLREEGCMMDMRNVYLIK